MLLFFSGLIFAKLVMKHIQEDYLESESGDEVIGNGVMIRSHESVVKVG